ncbi:haloacid dehalogenase type II [Curtobacterium sp. ISL-83]|uniref:haloacid dehalogenase type II n=1 Tax=Curtobacterium sp. ISL-83 TaxID=2819145 RepID=UPI001BECDD1C|nr:haloacid dehalogenase type II [Curtobacterium sp. ISL-83]MBT2502887.1 haloacid dehalogenase type II [Curtobacterium sp. ISL-83]
MTRQPVTIFFDVNETLSDLSSVAEAFELVGASKSLAPTWFASVLRDGFALTASGSDAVFGDIARNNARDVLSDAPVTGDLDDAVDRVMAAFAAVSVHPDVAPGLHALHAAGYRLFTLSNGPTSTAERLLREAGAWESIDEFLTVEGHTPWKPARASYLDAVARIRSEGAVYVAAVHAWDIHGASQAGLSTIWINRSSRHYPAHFRPPTITVSTVGEIPAQL